MRWWWWWWWSLHWEPKSWHTEVTHQCVQSLERLCQCCAICCFVFGCDCNWWRCAQWVAFRCNLKRRFARKDFLEFLTCASCKEKKGEGEEDEQQAADPQLLLYFYDAFIKWHFWNLAITITIMFRALCTKTHFLYLQLLFAAHVVFFRLDKYSLVSAADEVDKLSVLCAEDHPWITWTKM